MALRKISGPVRELATQDLNTITETGAYLQASNNDAGNGANYPRAVAGLLEVYTGKNFTFQRYTAYKNFGIYTRSYYGFAGEWEPWRKLLTE